MRICLLACTLIAASFVCLGAPHGASLLSIRLVPDSVSLKGAGASQRILVIGTFADALERDVTSRSRILIRDAAVARIDEQGRLVALADGQTRLTAEFAGRKAEASVRVDESQRTGPLNFTRDIGSILTKHGCNSNTCHGSVVGRGGFKLSQDALNPEEDHRWMREGGVYSVFNVAAKAASPPRVDLKEPERSLLLLKPTMTVPHGGGSVISAGSSDYETVLKWIRSGARLAENGSEPIQKVEVYPEELVLDSQGQHQLLVTARLSGGRVEDLTGRVRYSSSDLRTVEVSGDGLVKAKGVGETSVAIHVAGIGPVSARVAVIAKPLVDYPVLLSDNLIDKYVFAKLRRLSIVPSGPSSDAEFLRRVCLDVAGTLPPPERVREFLASNDPKKRDKLIEALVDSPEYVDYWTFRLADLFRVALWAQNSIAKASHTYWEWIRDAVAKNKPWDHIARERVAVQGYEGPVMHYQSVDEFRSPQDIMAEQVRVFLGRRLDCAQCHDHPYETWSQNQFWGMTAFFARLTRLHDQTNFVLIDYPGGHGPLGKGFQMLHPRTKEAVEPRFLDGALLRESQRSDPRRGLAEWMTSPDNPYFAEAAVNRMWSYFFGRGIVDPVDDFRMTNPPTHPKLLAALARDFRQHGYDLKHLVRLIVKSRTYQLSHSPNDTNRDDRMNYSRALPRPLDAEVLWDAINQFAEVEEDLERWRGGRASSRTRAINLTTPDLFRSPFLEAYGQPNRLTVPQRRFEANLAQALHMLAGSTYTSKLSGEEGKVGRLLKSSVSSQQIIEDLYLAALSRFPTVQERTEIEKLIGTRSSGKEALEDLAWSLISSREFAYNH